MNTLFKGTLGIDFGQFYISLHEDEIEDMPDMMACFVEHNNGLVGAAEPDFMIFTTASKDAPINLETNLLEVPPAIGEQYDEIVEVSCVKGDADWFLSEWGWEETHKLDIPKGTYRVRLSIAGFDHDYGEALMEADEDYYENPIPGQKYLLEFWPSPIAADEIVKQTTENANYWHKSNPVSQAEFDAKKEERSAYIKDGEPTSRLWLLIGAHMLRMSVLVLITRIRVPFVHLAERFKRSS